MFSFRKHSRNGVSARGESSQNTLPPLGVLLPVGVVREATDADFEVALRIFDDDTGWKLVNEREREGIKTYNMRVENSPIVLMKVCTACQMNKKFIL